MRTGTPAHPIAWSGRPKDRSAVRRLRFPAVLAGAVLMGAGVAMTAWGAYIPAKAALAQVLLQRSWDAASVEGGAPPPWPWADTRPVARITALGGAAETIVLSGADGRTLAFGPGHIDGTALPGFPGHSVVAAHRDTHFKFLRQVGVGSEITVETPGGNKVLYTVVDTRVIDARVETIALEPLGDVLSLVTCYPFDDPVPGGPLRYVVTAAVGKVF